MFLEFDKPFWKKDWKGFSILWEKDDILEIRSRDDNWLEDIFGFYTVDFKPNILCGWISGPSAKEMEMSTVENVKTGVMFLLRKFLKDMNLPDPVRIERYA